MGNIAYVILAVFILIVGTYIFTEHRKRTRKMLEEHNKKMESKLQAKEVQYSPLREEDLYLGLFVCYAKNSVKRSGKKISSNRLSPIEKEFRELYLSMMGQLPEIQAPYKKLKEALRKEELMVSKKGF